MSLLYDASLIVTPNAYKESKLYALKPQSGLGDMTVTRATTATRTNSAGLVESVPYNLVSYSEECSNNAWGKLNITILSSNNLAPNGTLTATRINMPSGTASQIFNQFTTIASTYTTSIWVKLISGSGNFKLGFYDNVSILTNSITVTSTWQRFTVTKSIGAAATRGCWLYSEDLNQVIEVWGGQVVEGSVPKDYFPTTTRLNIPRIDYPSLGGCPSILLEPQSTNLLVRSEEFDIFPWGKNQLTISPNIAISPNGLMNANKLNETISNSLHRITQNLSVVNATVYTFSIYAKKGENTLVQLALNNGFVVNFINAPYANFNLLNGTISQSGNGATATITALTNGWYRCSITATSILSGQGELNINLINSDTTGPFPAYIGNASNGVYIYGAQIEQGAYLTSYIPTVASTVTRNADVCFLNNIYTNGLISASGGTWFLDQMSNEFKGSGLEYSILLGSVGQNSLVIGINTDGTISFYKWNNSIININQLITNSNVPRTKIIVRWNVTTGVISIFLNGTLSHTFTSQSFANYEGLSLTDANAGRTIGSHKVNSSILFPTQLTDTECIQLTTL